MSFRTGEDVLYKAKACRSIFYIPTPASTPANSWHRCYVHLNNRMFSKLVSTPRKNQWCEERALSRAHHLDFLSHIPTSDPPLFRIYSDIVGTMPVSSIGGSCCVDPLIDHAAQYNHIYKKEEQVSFFLCILSNFLMKLMDSTDLRSKLSTLTKEDNVFQMILLLISAKIESHFVRGCTDFC